MEWSCPMSYDICWHDINHSSYKSIRYRTGVHEYRHTCNASRNNAGRICRYTDTNIHTETHTYIELLIIYTYIYICVCVHLLSLHGIETPYVGENLPCGRWWSVYSTYSQYHGFLMAWPLQWRHNEHDGVSNHQPRDYSLNRLFRPRSK